MTRFDEISAAIAQRHASSRHSLKEQTSARLSACLAHHWNGANPTWRVLVERHGVRKAQLPRTAEELTRLPLMTRSALRDGNFSERPNAAVFRCVCTSGSTHSAVRVPHSLEMSRATLFDNFLRMFAINGVTDLFPFYGVVHRFDESLSGSQTTMTFMTDSFREFAAMGDVAEPSEIHWERVRAMAPSTVASSPGFMMVLAHHVLRNGQRLAIPRIVVGGAPLSMSGRAVIERAFAPREILLFYPTSDAGALGCSLNESGDYVSFSETHVIEIVRADGSHVAEGEEGLVAVTALDSLAAPLIRYLVGDQATYLGPCTVGERVRLRGIRRVTDALIGDLKIPLADLEEWQNELARRGIHIGALQVAKRPYIGGRAVIVIRVETAESHAAVEAATLELVLANREIASDIRRQILTLPRIEVFPPGGLLQGRFKLPVFVDESRLL